MAKPKTYTVTCDWCHETRQVTIGAYWNYDGKTFLSKECRYAYKLAHVEPGDTYRARPVPDSDDAAESDADAVANAERAAKGA